MLSWRKSNVFNWFCFFSVTDSVVQAVSISLPTKLTSLSIAKVDCFIDSTVDLPIGCFLSMSVEFFFKNSSVNTLLCQTAYDGPVLSEVVGDMNCGMVTSSSEERTFRLNFKGDRASHEGGTLTCSISCTQVSTSSSKSSGPLKFSVTTSTYITYTIWIGAHTHSCASLIFILTIFMLLIIKMRIGRQYHRSWSSQNCSLN